LQYGEYAFARFGTAKEAAYRIKCVNNLKQLGFRLNSTRTTMTAFTRTNQRLSLADIIAGILPQYQPVGSAPLNLLRALRRPKPAPPPSPIARPAVILSMAGTIISLSTLQPSDFNQYMSGSFSRASMKETR